MSFEPFTWALKDAPTKDRIEVLVLIGLAEHADNDGCNAYPSRNTLARYARTDSKVVQKALRKLVERGLIALGDQNANAHMDPRYRTTVYDLLVPYGWYGDKIDRINEYRASRGRPPLTPEDRPTQGPAPERTPRSDKGKEHNWRPDAPNAPKKKQQRAAADESNTQGADLQESRGVNETPLDSDPEGSTKPPQGGLENPARGVNQTPNPVSTSTPQGPVPGELRSPADVDHESADRPDREPGDDAIAGTVIHGRFPGPDEPPGTPSAAPELDLADRHAVLHVDFSPAGKRKTQAEEVRAREVAGHVTDDWWLLMKQRGTPIAYDTEGKQWLQMRTMIKVRLLQGYTVLEIKNAMLELYRRRHKNFPAAQALDDELVAVRKGHANGAPVPSPRQGGRAMPAERAQDILDLGREFAAELAAEEAARAAAGGGQR